MTVQTDPQIDNSITHFKRGIGGKMCTNSIDGRAYLQPTQYQGLIIDIDQTFIIDRYSGFYLLVKAGEQVNFAFFERSGLQFNISVVNTSFVDLYAELFAPLDSVVNRKKPEYVNNDVVNVAFTNAVTLDGNALDFTTPNNLKATAGYETDYVSVSVSNYEVRTGVAGSRFTVTLPIVGHGTAITDDYNIANGNFISGVQTDGVWFGVFEFVGRPITTQLTTIP